MTMTNVDVIGNPSGPHVCPCGCGRLVGRDEYWTPSPNPREDLAATLDQRIADATARAAGQVAEQRARWARIISELRASMESQLETFARIDCPCCGANFLLDEYREHVVEGSTFWCDRERWGSFWVDLGGGQT